jgi:hypothetical protein
VLNQSNSSGKTTAASSGAADSAAVDADLALIVDRWLALSAAATIATGQWSESVLASVS